VSPLAIDPRLRENEFKVDDLHFGITRQCPLAIGPISMKAKIVSVSRSFILYDEHPSIHSCKVG
jgi:hypothetical protein